MLQKLLKQAVWNHFERNRYILQFFAICLIFRQFWLIFLLYRRNFERVTGVTTFLAERVGGPLYFDLRPTMDLVPISIDSIAHSTQLSDLESRSFASSAAFSCAVPSRPAVAAYAASNRFPARPPARCDVSSAICPAQLHGGQREREGERGGLAVTSGQLLTGERTSNSAAAAAAISLFLSLSFSLFP
jgi:hypothetical protein